MIEFAIKIIFVAVVAFMVGFAFGKEIGAAKEKENKPTKP